MYAYCFFLGKASIEGEINTLLLVAMSSYKTLPISSFIHGDLENLEIKHIKTLSLQLHTDRKNELSTTLQFKLYTVFIVFPKSINFHLTTDSQGEFDVSLRT